MHLDLTGSDLARFDRGLVRRYDGPGPRGRLKPLLAADSLIEIGRDRITVTPRGRFVVRNVAMAFDACRGTQTSALYSRTV